MSGTTEKHLPPYLRQAGDDAWLLEVWVQPGAKKSGLAGTYQGSLKVRIDAPAVDGKANRALLDFLARNLGLRKNRLTLASGQTGRRKTVRVESASVPSFDDPSSEGASA